MGQYYSEYSAVRFSGGGARNYPLVDNSIREGSTVLIKGHGPIKYGDGTPQTLPVIILGLDPSDLTNATPSVFTVNGGSSQNLIYLYIREDSQTEGTEKVTVLFGGSGGDSFSFNVLDTSLTPSSSDVTPQFEIIAEEILQSGIISNTDSVHEGNSIQFVVRPIGSLDFSGLTIAWSITGVDSLDISNGTLSGAVAGVYEGQRQFSFTIPIAADLVTEGEEVMRVNIGNQFVDIRVIDSSKGVSTNNDISNTSATPTYAISTTYSTVNEGSSATFTVSTTNVAAGTGVAYTISGVSSADVLGAAMSGSVTVESTSQATISIPIAADNLTEGIETLTVTAQGKSASVAINDTSTGTTESDSSSIPQGNYTLNVIVDLFGQVLYLKGLRETVASTSHTVEYAGTTFNWSEVDSLATTVTRDGNFTDEFAKEIADVYPSAAGIGYSTAVALVGASAIDSVLIAVAGADGNYVG